MSIVPQHVLFVGEAPEPTYLSAAELADFAYHTKIDLEQHSAGFSGKLDDGQKFQVFTIYTPQPEMPVLEDLPPFPPGNPFRYDVQRMGCQVSGSWVAMYSEHIGDRDPTEIIMCNAKTGQRFKLQFPVTEVKPMFDVLCPTCVFLGSWVGADLFYHPGESNPSEVVAQFHHQMISSPVVDSKLTVGDHNPWLLKALELSPLSKTPTK